MEVRASSSQLPAMTASVVAMMKLRQIEKSSPPTLNAPVIGSGIDL